MSEEVALLAVPVGERPKVTLQQAARDGREDIVRVWLNRLPRNKEKVLDAKDADGYTAMHYAAKFNRFKIIQLLVTNGAKAGIKTDDEAKFTPLHFASRYTPRIIDADTLQQEATSDTLEVTRLSSSKQAVRLFVQYCRVNVNATAQYGISSLHLACSRGNAAAVDILLQSETLNINIADANRDTPLHEACLYGDETIVAKILERLKAINSLDLCLLNDEEQIPLHIACREGHTEVVKLILRYGFEQRATLLSARDNENNTALHLACESGEKEIIKILLQNGSDLHAAKDDDITALHLAARHGFISVAQILLDSGEDIIEDVDLFQQTPLHYAAHYNQPEMIDYLLGKGASILAIDKDSNTPLLEAVSEGSVEAFDKLLDLGAPLDDLDKNNKSAVFLAAEKNHVAILRKLISHPTGSRMCSTVDAAYNTPLHAAAREGNLGAVKELLGTVSKINAQNEINKTAMHLAAEEGHVQIVHEFIKKQEDTIEDEDEEGNSPLHLACLKGHHNTCKLLIKHLANVFARNSILWTPLDCAASKGHDKIVRLLVHHEAEVDPTDKSKITPLHLASREGHLSVVVTLLQFGADLKAMDHRGFNALDLAIENGHEDISLAIVKSLKWRDALRNTTTNMLGIQTTPLRKLIMKMPEVAEEVFNRCTSTNETKDGKISTDSLDYKVTFNYEFLEDFRDLESRALRLQRALTHYGKVGETEPSETTATSEPDVESRHPDQDDVTDTSFTTSWGPVGFKKSQHPLSIMVESARTDLLKHPLVTSLLEYKWTKYAQATYFANLALYIIFLVFLTCFALLAPNPLTATCQSVFDGSFGSMSNLTAACANASAREAAPGGPLTTAECGICDTGTSDTTKGFLYACAGIVIFLALVRLIMEIFQLISLQFIDYIVDWVNWIELVLFIGTVIFAWIFNTDCQCPHNFQWQLGAVVLFFAWIDLIFLIRKLPLTGIYVVMFIHIFKTFCRLIILTMLLVSAFGLSFYMAFRVPEDPLFSRTPFSSAGRAIVKTMTMTTGELEFDNIFRQTPGGVLSPADVPPELPFAPISFFLWIIFLVLMPILLTNLLTGLAVDDIKAIQDAAELRRLQLKVELALNVEELMPRRLRRVLITRERVSFPNRTLGWFANFKMRVWGVERFDTAEKISNALNPPLEPIEHVQSQTRILSQDMKSMKRTLGDVAERNRVMELLITELCSRKGISINDLEEAKEGATYSRL